MALVRSEPGRVWRITLTRPEARNAVSTAMIEDLGRALGDAAADPGARVVLLRGDGSDFCADADFAELERATSGSGAAEYGQALEAVLASLADHPLPVIAGDPRAGVVQEGDVIAVIE